MIWTTWRRSPSAPEYFPSCSRTGQRESASSSPGLRYGAVFHSPQWFSKARSRGCAEADFCNYGCLSDPVMLSCHGIRQTLEGSFSAVSKPNFASKYAFESSRRDLHNALLCTAPKSHFFQKISRICMNLPKFAKIFRNFAKFAIFQTDFLRKFWDCSGAKECKSCRAWKMLSNAYFLAKFRFDTAENEPTKNSANFC